MSRPVVVPMFTGADAPAVSNVFINNGKTLCTIQITGTYSAAVLKVQGMVDTGSGEWADIAVFDLSNLNLKSKAQGNGIYQVAVEGILRIRFNVTEIDGGSLTAVANFM